MQNLRAGINELISHLKERRDLNDQSIAAIAAKSNEGRPSLAPDLTTVIHQAHVNELEYIIEELEQLLT
jgi:hypothetical protein